MSAARHMVALLKSHLEGDDREFLSVAMQAAAHEARLGHVAVAQQLRELVDQAKTSFVRDAEPFRSADCS